jgi:hypothetical protein
MTGREINKEQKRLQQGMDVNASYLLSQLRSKNTEIAKLKNKVKKLEEQISSDREWHQIHLNNKR